MEAEVANPGRLERRKMLRFLVDSGVTYSAISGKQLRSLGIEPSGERVFLLANGQPVKRKIGEARITFEGHSATCVVLFGQKGDSTLLGVTTLENLGLIFDPLRQKILSLPMMLAEAKKLFAQ